MFYQQSCSDSKFLREKFYKTSCDFVVDCHHNLLSSFEALIYVINLGFTLKTILSYQIGFIKQPCLFDNTVKIPSGITFPTFDLTKECLIKITVEPLEPSKHNKGPIFLRISEKPNEVGIYGNPSLPVVVVQSERMAMLLEQSSNDLCCPIALGNSNWPNKHLDSIIRNAPLVLFATTKVDYSWWQKRYPHIIYHPLAKFTSNMSLQFRDWVLAGILTHSEVLNRV